MQHHSSHQRVTPHLLLSEIMYCLEHSTHLPNPCSYFIYLGRLNTVQKTAFELVWVEAQKGFTQPFLPLDIFGEQKCRYSLDREVIDGNLCSMLCSSNWPWKVAKGQTILRCVRKQSRPPLCIAFSRLHESIRLLPAGFALSLCIGPPGKAGSFSLVCLGLFASGFFGCLFPLSLSILFRMRFAELDQASDGS